MNRRKKTDRRRGKREKGNGEMEKKGVELVRLVALVKILKQIFFLRLGSLRV